MRLRKLAIVATAGFSTFLVAAIPAAGGTSITGSVRSTTGHPLPYANVVVLGTKLWAVSRDDGSFALSDVPAGTMTVQCSYIGFKSSTKAVSIEPGKPAVAEFLLEGAIPAEGVVVVTSSCGRTHRAQTHAVVVRCRVADEALRRSDIITGCGARLPKAKTKQEKPAPPARFVLAQNHPNPFNPSTEIPFELGHASHARLRIYDVSGRLTRVVLDEMLDPGPQVVTWDGRNNHGEEVGAGIYFYRLEAADFTETRQLVVVR